VPSASRCLCRCRAVCLPQVQNGKHRQLNGSFPSRPGGSSFAALTRGTASCFYGRLAWKFPTLELGCSSARYLSPLSPSLKPLFALHTTPLLPSPCSPSVSVPRLASLCSSFLQCGLSIPFCFAAGQSWEASSMVPAWVLLAASGTSKCLVALRGDSCEDGQDNENCEGLA
jgi:hypothetical protein